MTIEINGIAIDDAAINRASADFEGGDIGERLNRAAQALALRELVRQRAVTLGLLAENDTLDDEIMDGVLEREVVVPEPTDAECRSWYERNAERFRAGQWVEARHVLLAAAPDDVERREGALALARHCIALLGNGALDFESIVTAYSDCPSREQGGHLGRLTPGRTVPELDDTLFRLPTGLCPRPVESRYGWHIVEVLAGEGGRIPPLDAVIETVRAGLVRRSHRRAVSQYLRIRVSEADIRGIEFPTVDSPLIQ